MKKLALILSLAWLSAQAADVVGPVPMDGVGITEAERRVLTPVQPPPGEPVAPVVEAPKSIEERMEAVADKIVGPVENVVAYGSREFAEREDVPGKILAVLGEGDKTLREILDAIESVRKDLLDQGFYLVRLSLARKGTYDRETKTLGVQVDEGRFGKINLLFENEEKEGTWFSRKQLLRRFKDIEEGSTFDYRRLRGALFDANSHPDLTIDTSIEVRKPIEGEGNDRRIVRYADLDLDVRESFPFHMVWEINNYGMEEVEEWQTSLTMQYMNLTKHDDVLTISPAMSFGAELMSIAGSYMIPHYWLLGGNTTIYGGYSTLDVDNVVPKLDLEGIGYFAGLQHSEYIYDSDRHLWAVSAGLLWRYLQDQYTAAGYKLNERGASIMPLSIALSYTGRKADFLGGRNFATVQGVFNFVNTGDKLEEIWTGADDKYWMLRWQLARLQPLFGWYDPKTDLDLHQWMLFLKLEGQYTNDNLIPLEKLSLGGYNSMRGYKTRGYLGDWGVYGTAEVRTPILVDAFASLFGDRTDKTAIDRLQFLGFVDYGWLTYNDIGRSDDSVFIYSAGLGARLAVTKYTQFKCDLAFPLRDTNWAKDESMEIYVSLQVQF